MRSHVIGVAGVCILAALLTVSAEASNENDKDIKPVTSDTVQTVRADDSTGRTARDDTKWRRDRERGGSNSTSQRTAGDQRRLTQRPTPSSAAPQNSNIEPYQAKPVEPYRSSDIDPVKARPVEPVQSDQVQPVQADQVRGQLPNRRGNRRPDDRWGRESSDRETRWHNDGGSREYERSRYEDERRQTQEVERGGRRGYDDRMRSGGRSERQREYVTGRDGRRIYLERDHSGRCVRRYVVVDGRDYDVDSQGRRIVVERGQWGIDRKYVVDDQQRRFEYDTDGNGREMIVERDRWGRVKQRQFYPEQNRGTIETYRAEEVQPYYADEVRPYQAEEVRPYYADEVKRKAPPEVGPDPSRYPRQNARESRTGGSVFFHTFGLAVPGVAYTYDNYATNTRTNVVAAGTLTKSSIRINANHTYDWNSAWDGRLIHGQWTEHDGGIRLLHGQEGKDWLMSVLKSGGGKATVVLYTDSVQYHGTPLD